MLSRPNCDTQYHFGRSRKAGRVIAALADRLILPRPPAPRLGLRLHRPARPLRHRLLTLQFSRDLMQGARPESQLASILNSSLRSLPQKLGILIGETVNADVELDRAGREHDGVEHTGGKI